jgi:hypothetical protein
MCVICASASCVYTGALYMGELDINDMQLLCRVYANALHILTASAAIVLAIVQVDQ